MRRYLNVVDFTTLLVSAVLMANTIQAAPVTPLRTVVIKSSAGFCQKGTTCHKDQAGIWTPSTKVAILGASIAEQTDVNLYVDIEVSAKTPMYACGLSNPEDALGCIFRTKYVGPGLYDYGATSGNTYLGSNITTTNMAFPTGYGIVIDKGQPVYVHLDVRNQSLIDITVEQDVWLYYIPTR
jgi:hypothetical protein